MGGAKNGGDPSDDWGTSTVTGTSCWTGDLCQQAQKQDQGQAGLVEVPNLFVISLGQHLASFLPQACSHAGPIVYEGKPSDDWTTCDRDRDQLLDRQAFLSTHPDRLLARGSALLGTEADGSLVGHRP